MISRRAAVGSGLLAFVPMFPPLMPSESAVAEETALLDDLELMYLDRVVRADIIDGYAEQKSRYFILVS